jgi:DNA-binding beta-propeller fold protein YncE
MKANLLTAAGLLSLSLSLTVSAVLPQTAAQTGAQTEKTGEADTSAAAMPNIQLENWTKPQSGWLYVLDPKPGTGTGGRIWLVDPETGKVMGSIRTGDKPDFALAPDGSRLYIASLAKGDLSEHAVIDTSTGDVVQRGTIDGRVVYDGLPPFSTMAVSDDGSVLRILIDAPKSEDADAFLLASFDTSTGKFLPRSVHLGNCGPGRFIANPSQDHFDFLCPRTNRVRLIRVDADARELQNTDVKLPWERRDGAAAAIEPSGSDAIAIVRGDGGVYEMNPSTQEFADTMAHPRLPNRIPPAAWPTSPDGSRIYLGYNNTYDRHSDNRFYLDYGRPPNIRPAYATADQFLVFDTHTWTKLGTIKTKMPFWSATVTKDGMKLYATAPQKHSILVIDTEKMRQSGVIKVGGAPALAVVAP